MFLVVSLFSLLAMASGKEDPRPKMNALAQEIAVLQRFLLTEAEFLAPANSAKIQQSLTSVNAHLKGLGGQNFAQGDIAMRTNLEILSQHMGDAERAFREGNKPFSRFMLQSSMQMCIACHTRGKVNYDFALPDSAAEGASEFDRGNFFFSTRQFDKGRKSFEKVVESYPAKDVGLYTLRKALLSLAVYFVKVKEEPGAAETFFRRVLKKEKLPLLLQRELKAWVADLERWKGEKAIDLSKLTETALVDRAKALLRADDFSLVGESDRNFHIRRLRASSILHRVLESSGGPSPAKGEALLLLGQIYHRVNHHLFFRFGEMYLKACVQEYKKTRVAGDCYNALEQMITEGFTGSSGTKIPDDEEVELMKLKRLAF
jgi:hypothetical protein